MLCSPSGSCNIKFKWDAFSWPGFLVNMVKCQTCTLNVEFRSDSSLK